MKKQHIHNSVIQGGFISFCIPVLLLAMAFGMSSYGGVPKGKLHLTITDESGKIVPARVEIIGSDGEGYIAEDGLLAGGDCEESRFKSIEAIPYDFEKSLAKLSKAVHVPFSKTVQFYSTGQSEINLPVGATHIKVMKGPEYYINKIKLEIEPGEITAKTIKLSRWVNMPKRGWYSADGHLHISRSVKELNPFILKMLQAEDVHVGNLVQMGTETSFALAPQYAHGKLGHYQRGHHMLASGQENPRTHLLGHALTLGADEPLHSSDHYLIYRLLWEKAKKQGAINGMAHMGQWGGGVFGMPLVLPHNLMNFIEVLQFNAADYDEWYDALNLGFRVTPTAGTDFPCGPSATYPGRERFYTNVKGELTYDNWLKSVREGRTFVTTGPILEFHINHRDIGDEITLEKESMVTIEGSVRFDKQKGDVERIEIIENGKIITSIPRVGDTEEITFKIKRRVDENSWYAVRGYKYGDTLSKVHLGHIVPATIFHSAPIYVTVNGAPPIATHPRAKEILQKYLTRLDDLKLRLNKDNLGYLAKSIYYTAVEEGVITHSKKGLVRGRQELLDEIKESRQYYLKLLSNVR